MNAGVDLSRVRSAVSALSIPRRHFRIGNCTMQGGIEPKRGRSSGEIVQRQLIESLTPQLSLIRYYPFINQGPLVRCDGLQRLAELYKFELDVFRVDRLWWWHISRRSGFQQNRLPIGGI
jgi:hypothetical protein